MTIIPRSPGLDTTGRTREHRTNLRRDIDEVGESVRRVGELSTQVAADLSRQRGAINSILELIDCAATAEQVQDVRARAEAIKGWARTHKIAKQLRVELLRVEISALVKLFHLDARDMLSPAEWTTAEFFASYSAQDIDAFIAEHGKRTSASGLYQAVRADEATTARARQWAASFRDAREPRPEGPEESDYSIANSYVAGVDVALEYVLDAYINEGEPFTSREVADAVIEESAFRIQCEPAVERGIREVVRMAIAKVPAPRVIGDVFVPRLITTYLDQSYVRIPVENARVSDVASMVKLRAAQLRQDTSALERLQRFYDLLRTVAGDSDRVGDVLDELIRNRALDPADMEVVKA